MQTTISCCIALFVAVSVAPIIADEDRPAPSQRHESRPIVLGAIEDEGINSEINFRAENSTETSTTPSDSETDESDEAWTELPRRIFSKTAEVAVTKSDKDLQRSSRPPVNAIPGLRSDSDPQDESPSALDLERAAELIDPNAPVEVIEERYKSGNLKVRREMTLDLEGNYVKHGQWTMFSESGDEVGLGRFLVNQRHGMWRKAISWGESPLLKTQPYTQFEAPFVSEAKFDFGQLTGSWTIKDNQGRLASEWKYRNGQLHGKAKGFYPDGKLREEIDYNEGLIDGSWTITDTEGKELENTVYQQGRKLATKHQLYDNGAKQWEGIFLHETFVVNTADDWWNTRPVTYKAVGHPERHGVFTSWYENGHKKFSGAFQHEVRTGEFTWWHENAQIAVRGSFADGERDGPWGWWHQNGQKAIQGRYVNGRLQGPWSYWKADGKLERKVDYTEENQPVAIHPVPTSEIPTRTIRQVKPLDEPVGTGVRVAGRRPTTVRRNPVRR